MTAPAAWFDALDSTNAEARRRAEAGWTDPVWIAARRQTAGRGRRGREWESPTGNLYATLLTLTDKPPAEAAQVSFVAALAVNEFVDGWMIHAGDFETRSRVKWPNDVLIDGRKVSGILVESGRAPDGRLWLAVGVGVNLAQAPVAPERPATRLADWLRGVPPPSPEEALHSLAGAYAGWSTPWERHGFKIIRSAWLDKAYGMGRPCTARLGAETIEGVAEGLDASGALQLRLPSGALRSIAAGEVFFPSS